MTLVRDEQLSEIVSPVSVYPYVKPQELLIDFYEN
jgi:hypothetical protein